MRACAPVSTTSFPATSSARQLGAAIRATHGRNGASGAAAEARAGATVLLVDERPVASGQFYKQLSLQNVWPCRAQ